MKASHDANKKERRRKKTPHKYAQTTEQRSRKGMTTIEKQSAPHRQKEDERSLTKSHVAGATPIYPLMDPGTPPQVRPEEGMLEQPRDKDN